MFAGRRLSLRHEDIVFIELDYVLLEKIMSSLVLGVILCSQELIFLGLMSTRRVCSLQAVCDVEVGSLPPSFSSTLRYFLPSRLS